ncbi:MAG: hypothetical protein AAFO72_14210 [Pseudomonadota bacterium]
MTQYVISLAVLILVPLALQIRRVPIWALFLVAGLIFFALAVLDAVETNTALTALDAGRVPNVDFMRNVHSAPWGAAAMLMIACLVWAQERYGALSRPRLTRALFWVLLAALLVESGRRIFLVWLLQPRDGIVSMAFIQAISAVFIGARGIGMLAFVGLVVLGLWSLVRARSRS